MTSSRSAWAAGLLLLMFTIGASHPGFAADKPKLTDQLRAAIKSGGPESARKRFKEIYPEHKDDYVIDVQSLIALVSEYMAAGNVEAGQAVAEINAQVSQDYMRDSLAKAAPGMEEQMKALQQAEKEQAAQAKAEEQRVQAQTDARNHGKPRSDLERFLGLYGDPASNRQLFVTRSCDGYLVVGAMWGDVAPWWMRSASNTVFTYADSFTNLALEFQVSADGKATSLTHDLEGLASPLKRAGPLPKAFENCLERPQR